MRSHTRGLCGLLQSIYSPYSSYTAVYSRIQPIHSPYSQYTSPEAPRSVYTMRTQSIYMHTEHIYSHTQSIYSPYTHIQPYIAIHSAYRAHTVHIQGSRRHAVHTQCVYSPCRPMQTHIQRIHPIYSHIESIYGPYTVHTQPMRIPVYRSCAAADARGEDRPAPHTQAP
jgi:hypothetical protein